MSTELYIGILLLLTAAGIALYASRRTVGDVWAFLGVGVLGLLAGLTTLLRGRSGSERGDVFIEAVNDSQRKQVKEAEKRVERLDEEVRKTKTAHGREKPGAVDEPNPETENRLDFIFRNLK